MSASTATPSCGEPALLALGIDTGGTYTDAVLYDDASSTIVARAKSPTTHHDLAIGITGAIDAVMAQVAGLDPGRITLVSMSTTLATNALVEGRGRPVAAIIIGLEPEVLARGGLNEALGTDPSFFIGGGHDAQGQSIEPLDRAALDAAIESIRSLPCEAVAITSQFSVRNPEHEIAARAVVLEQLGMPVSCSHELAEALNGPRRAVTTILNARLVSVIHELVVTSTAVLVERGIDAPLMVVRGDGSLVSAGFAQDRPIETILSGPAASLVGAAHLSGIDDALVSDIGGTTTDIAVLAGGRPVLSETGARVGGHTTMVNAVAMRTQGLGGDSEVAHDDRAQGLALQLGPRRVVPLALLEHELELAPARSASESNGFSAWLVDQLDRQLRLSSPSDLDGVFLSCGSSVLAARGGDRTERAVVDSVGTATVAARDVLKTAVARRVADRLVARGVLRRSAFTPTDAAHVLGLQDHLPTAAAERGAELFARRRDRSGRAIAADGRAVARATIDALVRRSGEALLVAAFAEDGLPETTVGLALVQRSLDRTLSSVALPLSVALPVVALGASAASTYPMVGELIGAKVVVPPDADVANAVGAVVGRVTITHRADIVSPEVDRYLVHAGSEPYATLGLDQAIDHARQTLTARLESEMAAAGAAAFEVTEQWTDHTVDMGGAGLFVDGRLTMTASGRPATAR